MKQDHRPSYLLQRSQPILKHGYCFW